MKNEIEAAKYEDLSDAAKARLAAFEARNGITREERVAHAAKFINTVKSNWRA